MKSLAIAVLTGAILAASPAAAAGPDDVGLRLDAARAAWQKGDAVKTAREAEAALAALQQRLGKIFGEVMPVLPAPWKADEVEVQSLADIGGGLSVSRGYVGGDSSMNASLLLDAPTGDAGPAEGLRNTKAVKVGSEDALLRFDPETKTGEITLRIDNRVMLEVQGDNINSEKVLIDAASGWKFAKIRALLAN